MKVHLFDFKKQSCKFTFSTIFLYFKDFLMMCMIVEQSSFIRCILKGVQTSTVDLYLEDQIKPFLLLHSGKCLFPVQLPS